jgi:hypothetical protein
MGLFFRKTKKAGKNTRVTLSNRGLSVSKKAGPLSVSSRGRVNVRLGKGLNFRKKLF